MLHAHLVEDVRRAEAAAMARLPDGALMQRAAAGLAAAVLDLLGGGYGRRVLLLDDADRMTLERQAEVRGTLFHASAVLRQKLYPSPDLIQGRRSVAAE